MPNTTPHCPSLCGTIFGYASGVTNRQKVSLKLAAKLKVMTRPHSHVALHKQAIGWEVQETQSLWATQGEKHLHCSYI